MNTTMDWKFLARRSSIPVIVHAPYATIAWYFSNISHVNSETPFSPLAADAFVVKGNDLSELKGTVSQQFWAHHEPQYA